MPADLTAILMPLPPRGLQPNDVVNVVSQNAPAAAWLRLAPLEKHDIHQLEVMDGQTGLPSVSPGLLSALSQNGGKALFLHVNHAAKQALLHAFEDGIEVASYSGEPTEAFAEEFQRLVGLSTDDVAAADDGTRVGFGQAASRTAAVVRGRLLLVPLGTPTGMGNFFFHDRGHDRVQPDGEDGGEDDAEQGEGESTRVAFFAFEGGLIQQAFGELPGKQLSQVIAGAPQEIVGPLIALRDATAKMLSQSDAQPGRADKHPAWHTHAFELLALCHAGVYSGGDTLRYIDSKVLALLNIGEATPIIDADDAEELEALPSLLDAMVEVLPCPKPPAGYGPLMEMIGPDEIGALVPWAKPGEPYDGAIFLVKPERLLQLVRSIDGNKLAQRLERFSRALYTARHGAPDGDAGEKSYIEWRSQHEQRSRPDIERFLTAWAELRLVFEIAAANQMNIGVIVYA